MSSPRILELNRLERLTLPRLPLDDGQHLSSRRPLLRQHFSPPPRRRILYLKSSMPDYETVLTECPGCFDLEGTIRGPNGPKTFNNALLIRRHHNVFELSQVAIDT